MAFNWNNEHMRQIIQSRGSESVYNDVSTRWTVGRPVIERKDERDSPGQSYRERELAEATKRHKQEKDFLDLLVRWGCACNHQDFLTAMIRLNTLCSQDDRNKSIGKIFNYSNVESVLSGSTRFGVLAALAKEKEGHDAVVAIEETVMVFGKEAHSTDPTIISSRILSFFKELK